jgi:signal transduction histidine kinase
LNGAAKHKQQSRTLNLNIVNLNIGNNNSTKNKPLKYPTFISALFISIFSYAQNAEIDSLSGLLNSTTDKNEIASLNLQLAKRFERINFNTGKNFALKALENSENDSLLAEANNQLGRIYFFMSKPDSALYFLKNSKEILARLNDKKSVAIINISLGAIQLRQGDYNGTIKTLTESAAYFEETGDKLNAAKCYSNISSALAELENYSQAIEYNEHALAVFEEKNLFPFQLITLPNLAAQHYKNGDTLKAINYNLEAEKLATEMGNKRSLSIIYNNLGSIFLDSDPEKAKDYLEKTIRLKNELNLKAGIEVALGNLGYLSMKNGDYKTSISYYKQVADIVNGKQLAFAYNQLKDCYTKLNQLSMALMYSEKARQLNDSILNAENQKIFTEIQTKYETEKKEKEISELKTKNLKIELKQDRNKILLLASLGILILTFFLVYFLLKNSKRKRIVAEQDLKIKNQEITQLLKNQELNGIDAIIAAQENERSRIADDLHDNLGSKIATLKLYIEEIRTSKNKTKEKQELLEKLKSLADETYGEIRKIAHNKNFGALINQGLIPSIKTIAREISVSEKLQIEVININVDKRIKNNIEIQVFRIVQELLTNIIKHADATEATIQFSEDENRINIMVEDNGKGFNTNEADFGLGLTNIEKRIENIDGNMVIDSTPGNGTTVILNIPL